MVEAAVTAALAAIAGVATLTNRLHTRITSLRDQHRAEISDLERRVDGVELRIAEKYVTKADLADLKEYMIRIEDKINQLILAKQ